MITNKVGPLLVVNWVITPINGIVKSYKWPNEKSSKWPKVKSYKWPYKIL